MPSLAVKAFVMWYFLYNVLLLLASPVIFLILLAKKRCRRGLRQRLGWLPPAFLPAINAGPRRIIWVHAVSLGEAVAAAPLVRALSTQYPDYRIVVSTVTETGREAVEQRLGTVAEHCYAPLDFPWVVSRVVRRLSPAAFLFVETELWPNLLRTLARRGVPVVLVNGRLSSRSFQRYRIIRPLVRRMLDAITLCLMQSERDADRVIELGAPPDRVIRTGNIKFDQPPPDESIGAGLLSRRALAVAEHEQLIVAGSTHAGEEEQLLACYRRLQREFPGLVLLLAPRHIERAADVEAAVKAKGLVTVRRSALGPTETSVRPAAPRVVILDTRGELAIVYRYAVLSFVGGTLVPIGGHNLLEPAVWGKPVFFGPHTDHCAEIAELLIGAGGGVQVRNGEELAGEMARLLREPSIIRTMGDAARRVTMENQGALERSLKLIGNVLETGSRRGETESDTDAPTLPMARGMSRASRGSCRERDPSECRSMVPVFPGSRAAGSAWAQAPLQVLAFSYGLATRVRARLYAQGWLPTRRLPCRVISVGNLTVGGTGKTPVVIQLARWLLAHDRQVGVLSRGYRRQSRAERLLVSDGRRLLVEPLEAGDEPHLIASRCPGAVVAVGSNRYRLGRWVLERFPIDCFLLDDGFQHLALHRDIDLLLVDASDPGGLRTLLPAGRLREPLSSAARATAVLVTRVGSPGDSSAIVAQISTATGRDIRPILVRFPIECCVDILSGEVWEVEQVSGRAALAFSGIANPASFRTMLDRVGITVIEDLVFPDHHAYTVADLHKIEHRAEGCEADVIVTTEKDAGKVVLLVGPEQRRRRILVVRLGTEIVQGQERLEELVLGVRGIGGEAGVEGLH